MTGWMHRSQDIVVEGIVLLRTVNAGGSELVRAQAGTDAVRLLLRNSVVELRTDEGKVLAGSPVDALGFFTLKVQARAWRDMSGAYITLRSGNREANLLFEVRLNRQERQALVAVAIDVAPGEGPLPFRALVGSLVDPAGGPVTHRPRGIATDLPTVWTKLVAPDGTDVGTEPWVEVDERGMFLLPLPDDADGVLDEVTVVVATGETIDGEMVLLTTGDTRIVTSNHVTWCRVAVTDALRLDEYGALSAAVGETPGTGGFGLADWWSGFTTEELRAIPWAHLRRRARTAGVPIEMVAAAWQARLVDTVANENGVVFPLAGVDDLAPPFSREEVLYGVFRVRGRSDRHAFRLSKASLTTVLSRAVSDHYVDPRFGDVEGARSCFRPPSRSRGLIQESSDGICS